MRGVFVISPLLIVALLLAVLMIFLIRRPGSENRRSPRTRRHRPGALRWICGLVALALIVAVVASSWPATSPEETRGDTAVVLVPGGPSVPPLDEAQERDDIGEVRFIHTVVVMTEAADVKSVYDAASVVINWPDDRGRTKTIEGSIPGGEFSSTVTIDDIWASHRGSTEWQVSGSQRMRYHYGQGSGTRSGGLSVGNVVDVDAIGRRRMIRAPLSLVPTLVTGQPFLVTHLTPAHHGDPIETTASEWLTLKSGEIEEGMRSVNLVFWESKAPNGVRMLGYAGPASWMLLLAAILLAQLFPSRRRAPAFVAALFAFVLLAIGLDRVMVERHAGWLERGSLNDAERERVTTRMKQSFFHADRVEEILSERGG